MRGLTRHSELTEETSASSTMDLPHVTVDLAPTPFSRLRPVRRQSLVSPNDGSEGGELMKRLRLRRAQVDCGGEVWSNGVGDTDSASSRPTQEKRSSPTLASASCHDLDPQVSPSLGTGELAQKLRRRRSKVDRDGEQWSSATVRFESREAEEAHEEAATLESQQVTPGEERCLRPSSCSSRRAASVSSQPGEGGQQGGHQHRGERSASLGAGRRREVSAAASAASWAEVAIAAIMSKDTVPKASPRGDGDRVRRQKRREAALAKKAAAKRTVEVADAASVVAKVSAEPLTEVVVEVEAEAVPLAAVSPGEVVQPSPKDAGGSCADPSP